jgi:hypothetical protein
MKPVESDIDRRTVIEAYATYDCSKKGRQTPDFAKWDWSQANMIDKEMERAGLKIGVPAGYQLWDKVEVTMSDLRECAVEVSIFSEQIHRKLGLIERDGWLDNWESKICSHLKDRSMPSWYDKIKKGEILDETAPFLLRPAVRGEFPARWYIEDGSGRAITFIANAVMRRLGPSQPLAIGYLGRKPDPLSSFMHEHFPAGNSTPDKITGGDPRGR